jgi:hypothetical protein
MYGLRVQLPGRPPVTMALDQQKYQVSVYARWHWRLHGKQARSEFSGTGMDDRDDLLRWFRLIPATGQEWVEITVVDTTTADPPRRARRRQLDWHALMRRRRQMDRRQWAQLSRLVQQPESHPPPLPPPPVRAEGGFVVEVDGQFHGSAGIGGRGWVGVSVLVARKGRRLAVNLGVHGGEKLARDTYRWRNWPWGRLEELDVGDRVRIELGTPDRLDLGEIASIDRLQLRHWTKEMMREELADLTRKLQNGRFYTRMARERIALDRSRPRPRSYPRKPIT